MSGLMLSKLIAQLLLPPAGLLLLAAIGLMARRKGWGRALLLASLATLWLLSLGSVRDTLTRPLEYRSPALSAQSIAGLARETEGSTAIVLLGGGIQEQAVEYGGANRLQPSAMIRTVYAAWLARQTGLPVYASGGRPLSDASESEGEVMRRQLLEFGLGSEKIHAEQTSENTWQNATHMRQILQARGIGRVVLVTSAWHMPRSRWCFKQQGFRVIAAPTDFLTSQRPHDARGLIPDAGVLAGSSLALHEYLGLVWYHLRYGQHWDWHKAWPWE